MERNEICVIGCALCGKVGQFDNAPKAMRSLEAHMEREHNKVSPYHNDAKSIVMIGFERAVDGLIQPQKNTDPLSQFLETRRWMAEKELLEQ